MTQKSRPAGSRRFTALTFGRPPLVTNGFLLIFRGIRVEVTQELVPINAALGGSKKGIQQIPPRCFPGRKSPDVRLNITRRRTSPRGVVGQLLFIHRIDVVCISHAVTLPKR